MTPEQKAAEHLFGNADYVCINPEHPYPDPRSEGNRVSYDELVQRYRDTKRIYVAGPMRGYPEFNYPAFHSAAALLRAQGHVVFSPAEKDIERDGVDWGKAQSDGNLQAAMVQGFSLRQALGDDLAWICAEADAVALLPGWENSKGANAERATAIALGLELILL